MILSYVTSWLYQHLFVWNLPSITHTGPNGKTNMPSLPPKQKRLNDGATQFFWKQKMRMDGSSLCTESGILTSFLFVSSAGVFYSTIPEPVAAQKSHRWNPTKTKSTRKKTFVHPFPTSALVKAICKKNQTPLFPTHFYSDRSASHPNQSGTTLINPIRKLSHGETHCVWCETKQWDNKTAKQQLVN